MHTRLPSDSTRIPIAYSSSSPPTNHRDSRDYLSSSKHRKRSPRSPGPAGLAGATHRAGYDPASWLTARVGRSAVRRGMVLAGLGLSALLLLSSTDSRVTGDRRWSLFSNRPQPPDDLQVPLVDRTALEKLRLLEIHMGADEEDVTDDELANHRWAGSPAHTGRDPDAPPLVEAIPDMVKPNPSAPPPLAKIQAHVLDEQTCGARDGAGCQFLIPAWLGEQETKAQQHLYQLGLLALALNRTLVLPNVSKSRLGCCYKNPFAFYYSPSSLADLGIPTISQDDFVAWTLQRDPPPSAQVVSMVNAKPTYGVGAIEIDSSSDPTLVPNKPSRNLCLRTPRTRLDFSGHSPLAIYPPEGFHKNEDRRLAFGESVINTLRSREVGSKSSRASSSLRAAYKLPDVLAFNYELRFPILSPSLSSSFAPASLPEPLPFSHFPYAQTWTDLGAQVATSLSPFIAIHWRTETLTPNNLAPCAQSLLSKLLSLKAAHPSLENVYLATDYPIEALDPSFGSGSESDSAVAHSGTFAKVVTEQHHAAMRRFLREFDRQAKGKLRLTTFAKEQRTLKMSSELAERIANLTTPPPPPSNPATVADTAPATTTSAEDAAALALGELDSGLYGILDKEVAMRAEVFLTGVPGVGSSTKGACAKLSSFTNQLIGAREERREAQRGEGGRDGLGQDGEEEEEREEREEKFEVGTLWNSVTHFSLSGEEVD
ncbi:hypothetical protein JCM11641_005412 [Rhodosporidiobolus odoratus]